MKRLSLAALAVAGIVTALPAAAQFAKPEDAIKYRKARHDGDGHALRPHRRDGAGPRALRRGRGASNAEIATMMSKLPFAAFGEGTDMGDTRAKPKIWTDNDKFVAAATKMQEEMAKLNVAAKSGNLDQIKAAFGPVGQACKACHDDFRKE